MDEWYDDSRPPRIPPPLKTLTLPGLKVLPDFVQELINATWYAASSREPLRYERLALAYHGFRLGDYFGVETGLRVRQLTRLRSENVFVAKRVPTTCLTETEILSQLSSKRLEDRRNHTATPNFILWGKRIHITPQYHRYFDIYLSKFDILRISQQLVEAVHFMHENCFAHLDISTRNFLFSNNANGLYHPIPHLLLMDMEYSVRFSDAAEPIVNLWEDCPVPPEGLIGINAFAYDMLCTGRSFRCFIRDHKVKAHAKTEEWPDPFCSLMNRMLSDRPELRPDVKEAKSIMQAIDVDPEMAGQGESVETTFEYSLLDFPSLTKGTLPQTFSDSLVDGEDW